MRMKLVAAVAALLANASAQAGNFPAMQAAVVYNPVSDTYTLRGTGIPAIASSFRPGDIGSSIPAFASYAKTNVSTSETFRLLNSGGSNGLINLTYADYGQRRHSVTVSGQKVPNPTRVGWKGLGGVPRSGSTIYKMGLGGRYVVNSAGPLTYSFTVVGRGTLAAYFDTAKIDFSATVEVLNARPEITTNFGPLTGTGTIDGANYSGIGPYNDLGFRMRVRGTFTGDQAWGQFLITSGEDARAGDSASGQFSTQCVPLC
jgi:hypothetical protein